MKKTSFKKPLSLTLCMLLIAAMATFFFGCKEEKDASSTPKAIKAFTLSVEFSDGSQKSYDLESEAETVGEALQEEGLIAGEEGDYGLYVKTVDGQTLDYDKDGMYWAFYENGEYAMEGVDKTQLKDGGNYSFKAEK